MRKLKEKFDEKKIDKIFVILDNLSQHKNELLKEFYYNNDIKVI